MGKKTETAKKIVSSVIAAPTAVKPAVGPDTKPVTKPAAKPAARKAAAAKPKKAAPTKKTTTTSKPVLSLEEMQLRAYFISEARERAGLPGDAHQDWVEAERQLLAEHKAKKSKKA